MKKTRESSEKPKIIVILGPTASGKSELAIFLARKIALSHIEGLRGAEIISADSRQIYRGLDIGTGKITRKEMQDVPHYLLDAASPKKVFTVAEYQKLAKNTLQKILRDKKIPVVCGGTGLYIDALIHNLRFPEVPPNKKLRKKLEKESAETLFLKLQKIDPRRAKTIDRHNKRRLVRALEIILTTKKPVAKLRKKSPYKVLKIGIFKTKPELRKLISERLQKRLRQGLVKEVRNLVQKGLSAKRLYDLGLEYRYVSLYLQNKMTREEMIRKLESAINKYAKRQMTWFKKDSGIHWVKNKKEALRLAKKFLPNNITMRR